MKKNLPGLIMILLIFILSALVVLPTDKGIIGGKPLQLGLDLEGGLHLVYKADLSKVTPGQEAATMEGIVSVITNRVNPFGVSEPVISKQGTDHISVDLPGINLSQAQKERIGSTALLVFGEKAAEAEAFTWQNALGNWKPATADIDGVVKQLDSSYFNSNTSVVVDNNGKIMLRFEWNDEGSKISAVVTKRLLGQQLGIFEGSESLMGDNGVPVAPRVNDVISTGGVIEGLSVNEAQQLSKQLNAGRLPVALEIIYEQTVSPVLGSDFVGLSVKAGLVGMALVMLFMMLYYRVPGIVASLALLFYVTLSLAIFKLVPVTLTLAGIGGFIVSIGMAVDANVLIFARMRDEIRAGRTLGAAMEAGFNRAWSAIRDSNVSIFIVCAILFWVGSSIAAGSSVKGFALTLFIGVAVSMFTAISTTRVLLRVMTTTGLGKKNSLFIESGEANA